MSLVGEQTVVAEGRTDPAANPLATILAAINSSQRESRELREELQAAQEEAADKAARKVERPYLFQKKAHEEQASFNDGLVDHISDAELQLAWVARMTAEHKVARKKSKADEVEKVRRSVHDLPERAKALARWDRAGPSSLVKPPIHGLVGPILCFLCGGPGHIKRDCPRNSVAMYPFSLVVRWCCASTCRRGAEHVWGGR